MACFEHFWSFFRIYNFTATDSPRYYKEPINYLTEEEYQRPHQTPNFINADFELEKVLETQKALNTIDPEFSPNSRLNRNRQTPCLRP